MTNSRVGALLAGIFLVGAAAAASAADGLVRVQSSHDVSATADRLVAALESKGLTVFARIDHAAGAARAELELAPTELVIFGNPKVGTPLMQCARTAGIDLPQKALVWLADDGRVWLAYNDPDYVASRHGLDECAKVTAKIKQVLANFAGAATKAD